MRQPGSKRSGGSFTLQTINSAWRKGEAVRGYDSKKFRKDACGAWMSYHDYGKTSSDYGWEIDHIRPASKGGSDNLSNLQPLQWKNNRTKGDNYPNWGCALKSA